MSVVTLIVALILLVIAWKVLTGLFKAGAIVLVIALAGYFLTQGKY